MEEEEEEEDVYGRLYIRERKGWLRERRRMEEEGRRRPSPVYDKEGCGKREGVSAGGVGRAEAREF